MTYVHKNLAQGRWTQMTLVEQMANIGSEVERALKWRGKNRDDYAQNAFIRALELIDLALACTKEYPRLKELARVRETLVDFFAGSNEYGSTEESWKRYFLAFNYAARRNR